jgi:hypothetical protein
LGLIGGSGRLYRKVQNLHLQVVGLSPWCVVHEHVRTCAYARRNGCLSGGLVWSGLVWSVFYTQPGGKEQQWTLVSQATPFSERRVWYFAIARFVLVPHDNWGVLIDCSALCVNDIHSTVGHTLCLVQNKPLHCKVPDPSF